MTEILSRPYSTEDVERLRGSVRIEHTLARLGAERLRELLATREDWRQVGPDYERRRRPRVEHVQKMTDRLSRTARIPGPLRDAILPIVGPRTYREAYGPLREPVERGRCCDFRVVNLGHGAGQGGTGFGEWPMHLQARAALPIAGGRPRALASYIGIRVHAVAGIGNPQRFFDMLRALGVGVVPHAFADHHAYRPEDLQFGNDLPVLMTEKDAVKCAPFADARCFAVPVDAELPAAFWVALLDRLDRLR